MSDADRRQYPRHTLQIEGFLTGPGGQTTVVTLDVSEGGVGFEAHRSFIPGTRVTLEVGSAEGQTFSFRGTVVWCIEVKASGLPTYRMGMVTDIIGSSDGAATAPGEKAEMLRRILDHYGGK